ncbi:MAG: hypothetical protein QOJ64_3931 [Acidobacteriota bacterium]|nr:hypothetical protein [Acidobacteriota bacterium]
MSGKLKLVAVLRQTESLSHTTFKVGDPLLAWPCHLCARSLTADEQSYK